MKRKTIFRFKGKRKDTGEWFYGNLHEHTCDGFLRSHISDQDWDELDCGSTTEQEVHEVDPKTVCQFIGMNDIHSDEIYTGDRIRIVFISDAIEGYEPSEHAVEWDSEKFRINPHFLYNPAVTNIKIIGNIHDDPAVTV